MLCHQPTSIKLLNVLDNYHLFRFYYVPSIGFIHIIAFNIYNKYKGQDYCSHFIDEQAEA